MADTLPLCLHSTPENHDVVNISVFPLLLNGSHVDDGYSLHVPSTVAPGARRAGDDAGAMWPLGWFETVLLVLCLIGVSGNVLNLLVLTRRRFCSSLNQLESSANYGLVALALSDLGFCLVVLPHVFMGNLSKSNPILMHYRLYGVATINLFLMISTWLIIIIAVNRWIVVVYPLKAKSILSQQSTVFFIFVVYVSSVLFTLPYYIHMSIRRCRKLSGEETHEFYDMYDQQTTQALRLYIRWLWPIFADFIPLLTLGLCNMRLIREIRKTTNNNDMGTGRRSSQRNLRTAGSKVTVTLMSIIIMYLVLVTPCEIMKYINPYKSWGKAGFIVANVTNALQTANFAFNFVLYCLVNATFRQTLKDMVRPGRAAASMSLRSFSIRGESMMLKGEEKQAMLVRRNSQTFTVLSTL